MTKITFKLVVLLILLLNPQRILAAGNSSESISIPCNVKECEPKWGDTKTQWYKGDKNKPAIIWYGGGSSDYTGITNQPIVKLVGDFDIIMVASPIKIDSKNKEGYPYNAYNKYNIYRMKQVAEHYKKLLNKPIWLGGISAGGPRMIGVISGDKKERPSDIYAGLIFSTPYVSKVYQGSATINIPFEKIKYEMNLPILVFQHARDLKPAQHPTVQKTFTKRLTKKNAGKTELILLTEGDPKNTSYDGLGSHHWFSTNLDEVARVVSKFIMDNTN
jgi:hypothetical protein